MPKRSSKKKDLAQLAHSIVERATEGESEPIPKDIGNKNPAAVALGKLGGKKGGPARAKKLSKKRKKEIAEMGANARWGKKTK